MQFPGTAFDFIVHSIMASEVVRKPGFSLLPVMGMLIGEGRRCDREENRKRHRESAPGAPDRLPSGVVDENKVHDAQLMSKGMASSGGVLVTNGKSITYRIRLHEISQAQCVTEKNGFNLRFRVKRLQDI